MTAVAESQRALPAVPTGYEVTFGHIAALGQQRDELTRQKADVETSHLRRIAVAYELGAIDMDGLAAAYCEYREVADPGYSYLWDAAIPVASARISNYARSRPQRRPNGPDGSWRGPYPFDDGPTPADATAVAYILFDDLKAVCYVGSTGGFRGRINRHARDGKQFSYWHAYPCRDRRTAYDLEYQLIREHQPYLNKAGRF